MREPRAGLDLPVALEAHLDRHPVRQHQLDVHGDRSAVPGEQILQPRERLVFEARRGQTQARGLGPALAQPL